MIVFATIGLSDVQSFHETGLPRYVRLGTRQEFCGDRFKRLTDTPDAWYAIRIDIAKHPQNTLTVIRPRRKSIDMQTTIIGAPGLCACLDLRRTIAGGCQT